MANLVFDFLHNYHAGERRDSEPANAYQYDEGHVIEAVVPVVVTSCEIHYWIRGMEKAEAYVPDSITPNADGTCTILGHVPNEYFQTNGELRVYIVVTDGDASLTTYEGRIQVCHRSMPDDYVDDDPENEATRVLTEAQEAAATATAAAETCEEVLESIPEDYSTLSDDVSDLKDGLSDMSTATASDVGKALKAKTVSGGKVTEWEFGEAGGSGGSPKGVILASQMTNTDENYLYLGTETGYDYGYVYVYLSGVWTKTTLYGKGQAGYSPVATVTQTATGVEISITDENGTTTAEVANGTATDEQVDAWLDEHPEATTSVEDGSISVVKLATGTVNYIDGKGEEIALNTPKTTNTKLLIDTSEPVEYQIPEVNDEYPTLHDTYSSNKIETIISELAEEIGIGAMYENPVATSEDGLPDPCLVKDNNVFYVFTTYPRIKIHKSVNLVDWEYCGQVITDIDYSTLCTLTNNQTTKAWAPCVIKHGDLWLMYVSIVAETTAYNCHMCVFSASNPDGKWKYRGEITNASLLSLNDCIDADVVRDSDGKLYMFIGSSYGIYLIKLSDDGLSIDSSFTKVLIHPHTPSGSNDTRLEASYCYWRNGYYYLFNTAGLYTSSGNYHVVVSRSASLEGPYLNESGDSLVEETNTGTTILSQSASLKSCGHNSNIVTDNDGNDWLMYHAYVGSGAVRQLCLQRIHWDDSTGFPYFTDGEPASNSNVPKF